ncbi:MAG: SDR family NAD(P)-dependent oxidoreductase, partial [Planctomycetota bacterium]
MTERRVVVTGGGRGIGRAIVERFARAGHEVLALGRDLAALERTRSELAGLPGNIAIEALDVTDEARVAALFDEAGPVDILVNNAGQSMSAPLVKHGFEDWNRML